MSRNQTPPEKLQALTAILKANPGTSGNAQCARILEALGKFGLDSFEASRYLDCYYPPARVMTLRKRGHQIETHWRTIETESGDTHRVGLWVLNGGAA